MTSTASQPNSLPAQNSTSAAAPSYASAAGSTASKKPAAAPLIATGSNPPPAPPVVVGSSAPPVQHAKSSMMSPVNGRPPITPAVPTVSSVPAVAHGSTMNGGGPAGNGGADHGRKPSVTSGGYPNYGAGAPAAPSGPGAAANASKPIQFGFQDSPSIVHSTPQQPAANVAIPASARVPSPARSPAPIPIPQQSGGRPPAGMAPSGNGMVFGSLGGDGERHMRQPSIPNNPNNMPLGNVQASHIRRESGVSMAGPDGAPSPGPGRGGFPPQGRGRGYNNPQYQQNMGFPPSNNYRGGPNAGRGGLPPPFQGQRQMSQYQNQGQPNRSPALAPSLPHTPNMQPSMPVNAPYYYPSQQPQGMQPYTQNQFFYDPARQAYPGGMPHTYQTYPQMGGMPPGSPAGMYGQPFGAPTFPPPPPGPQPMSRNSSQISDRPANTVPPTQAPIIAQTPAQAPSQPKAPAIAVGSNSFMRPPKKSAALQITDPTTGQSLDLSGLKQPASPAPSIQQSKTPPIVQSTPTPPPKPATPSHARTESQAASKKPDEQVRNEMKEKVEAMRKAMDEAKAREEETARLAEEKAAAEAKAKAEAEAKELEEKRMAEQKAAEDAKRAAEEAEAKAKAEADAKAKAEAEEKAKAEAEAAKAAEKAEEPEDDVERMIREMEEADARREKEQAELEEKRKAAKAAAKKLEDEKRVANAAEEDRKLREAEAEMERLEEEKERKRKEREASGAKAPSFAEAFARMKISDSEKESGPPTPNSSTARPAGLSLGGETSSAAPTPGSSAAPSPKPPMADRSTKKPAALNLEKIKTSVEPPQPSAALQSLKSARFLTVSDQVNYPPGIHSPNPALNAAVARKGKQFKYDSQFLLQFRGVFTEPPSLEFGQQVKALIGDSDGSRSASARPSAGGAGSGRNSQRGGNPGFPSVMGSFVAGGSGSMRTLPPGTTSEQRMAISSGQMARPPVNPISSFGRPGGFPGGSQMSRQSSSSNMVPNSPRQGSKARERSKGGNFANAKAEAQAAKTMPLTAGMEIKGLQTSASGWKPTSVGNKSALASSTGPGGLMDPMMVQRKVKAALNKMTPEKFDTISEQILQIAAQSVHESDGRTLRQVIQLTFEKATDEAHFSSMYAKFCKRMLDTISPEIRDESIVDKSGNVVSGGALFRKYLLNRCQEEFERGWSINLPEPASGEGDNKGGVALMSDEYYVAAAAKRRGLGLVQFIGELYKLSMLTERIMHECVRKLLEYQGVPDEAEVESLSKLLRTVGSNLDSPDRGRQVMDAYFQRIQSIIDLPDLPSRLKFMLMDVLDLRKSGWATKDSDKGPKTLEEVRQEVQEQAAQKAADAARANQRGGPGGRPTMGRGDARQLSANYNQPAPNQVGFDDLRRLKTSANRPTGQGISLGPTSMFSSRSNSGRRLGPGGSLSRQGEESGASSRTGTPPTREPSNQANAFSVLATMDGENPASPPAVSPALSKVAPDSSASTNDKK